MTKEQKAFTRAEAGYEFAGKKLQPVSAVRQAAAATMGLRFGLVDESDIFTITVDSLKKKKSEKQSIQFYNQMFSDVVTVLWLCSVPESRVLRSLRRPDEARSESFKWADSKGITLTSARYYEAAGVFFTMMQDISVSTAIPDDEEKSSEEGDDDPNE